KAGTVTWLPVVATEVDRGGPLYRVDNKPVCLFFGDTPLFRRLDTVGTKGPDVRVVKENLTALGFPAGGRTDEFTDATSNAIKRWRHRKGGGRTGPAAMGDGIVLPGKVGVDKLKARRGAPAETEVLSVTGASRALTAAVDRPQLDLAKPGVK